MAEATVRKILASECAYSSITRMELLGFPGITSIEENLIKDKLQSFIYLSLTHPIEDIVIKLRKNRKIKLPDAIIAATAIFAEVELLTLDKHLKEIIKTFTKT